MCPSLRYRANRPQMDCPTAAASATTSLASSMGFSLRLKHEWQLCCHHVGACNHQEQSDDLLHVRDDAPQVPGDRTLKEHRTDGNGHQDDRHSQCVGEK